MPAKPTANRGADVAAGGTRSVVEAACEEIALAIASGSYPAGSRLPSVRRLAVAHRINPSTVQVVLGRLQSTGFVQPQAGVGFIVCDIARYGGIETWPYLFRFAQRLPERASQILSDVLALRRTLVAETLRALAARPGSRDLPPVRDVVDQLELQIAAAADDAHQLAKTELHAFRTLTVLASQSVITAVLNSIGAIYLEEPRVLAAMYVEPMVHIQLWRQVLDSWERGEFNQQTLEQLLDALARFDAGAVRRYRDSLLAATE